MFPFICSVLQHVALVIMSMNRPGSHMFCITMLRSGDEDEICGYYFTGYFRNELPWVTGAPAGLGARCYGLDGRESAERKQRMGKFPYAQQD